MRIKGFIKRIWRDFSVPRNRVPARTVLAGRLREYLFSPRWHFSRFQFNLVSTVLIGVGLLGGAYLTASKLISIFAANDTYQTWTFNSANASSYTYDALSTTVDDSGARITNKILNSTFDSDLSNWTEVPSYTLNDQFTTAAPTTLVSGGLAAPTPTLGSEQLINPGLEAPYSAGLANNWINQNATVAEENAILHGGLSSQKITSASSGAGVYKYLALTNGIWYQGSLWANAMNSSTWLAFPLGGSSTYNSVPSDSTWHNYTRTLRYTGTAIGPWLRGDTGTGYLDDASVKPLTLSSLFITTTEATTNKIVSAGVTLTAGTQAGVVVNLDSASSPANFVIAYHDGTNAHLEKAVGGVYTSLINTAATYSAGATIKVIKNANSYILVYNNAQIGTAQTISDAGIASNTLQGLFSTYASNSFANFLITTNLDGTQAEPTGGTRTITDTNGKLSIGSGLLNFATGTAANDGIWYSSISRGAGKILVGTMTLSADGRASIGWDNDSSGTIYDKLGFITGSINTAINSGTLNPSVGSYSMNTEYKVAIIMKSTGHFYFIKGGSFTNWTLLYISNLGSAAGIPSMIIADPASVFTADNIRIPTATWLPTPLAYSTFGTPGATATETTGPDAQTTPSLALTGGTVAGGTLAITPTLGSEVLSNSNMETGNPPSSWLASNGVATRETTIVHSGSASSKFVAGAGANDSLYQSVNTVAGGWYFINEWTYGDGTNNIARLLSRRTAPYTAWFSGQGSAASSTWLNTIGSGRTDTTDSVIQFWTSVTGNTYYVDDVSLKPLALSSLFSTVPTSDSDVIVDANVTLTAGTQAGLVVNLDDASNPQNFVIAYQDGTNVKLDKAVAGVYTNLINASTTYSAGATLRVIKDGTKYRVYYNNALVGTEQTISDAGIISNTKHGMFSTYSGNTFDNFTIWPRGSSTTKFTDAPFEELTATRDTTTKYAGAGSVKLVAGGTDANYLQSLNVGDGESYVISGYAYSTGVAITSADLSIYFDGSTQNTTYTDAGGGWYKISATVTGANSAKNYGVRVKAGKTIYLDSFSVAKSGNYNVFNTSGYYNVNVAHWDSFASSETTPTGSSVRYQICVNDGNTCEANSTAHWQYYIGGVWTNASNITSHYNTAAELTPTAMQALPVTTKKIAVKTILISDGMALPSVAIITIGMTTDTTKPITNASNIAMTKTNGGTSVTAGGWTNDLSSAFSWTAGADDEGGSGIKGYCLYLGTSPSGDPETAKGLLGTSPVSTSDSTCQFIVAGTSVDFATLTYRGSPWITTSSSPYYFNVKAVDNAGNVYPTSIASFQFYYDGVAPTNVSYTSCASGSFANADDMNFSWPTSGGVAASDANSVVAGYSYKIGTGGTWRDLTGSSYTLSSSTDTEVSTPGNYVIYFRTRDTAGNNSDDATIRTCNLSYGGAAPTFGGSDSVTIDPSTSTENNYALSWPAASATHGQNVAHYYYMVNTTPPSTLATLQGNATTYVDNGTNLTVATDSLANVNKGTNTVYVVAVDDVPSYSPSNYISGTFTLNSNDPDNVGNLVSSDSSIKSSSQWNVTLTWTAPDYQGAGNLTYLIKRSSDGTTFSQVGTATGLSYVDNTPSSAKYFYKVYTKDGANAQSSGTNATSITPTGKWTSAPDLSSGPDVSSITTKKATITWSTSRGSDSKIAYGTSSGSYSSDEVANSSQVTSHSVNLSNLSAGTTYYYRAKGSDEDGNTGESEEKTFTTASAPTVKDVSAKSIGLTTSTIKYTSQNASKVKIYYGTTTSFGGVKEVSTSTSETTYTTELAGLTDGTKYYYKINTFDSDNSEYEGTVLDFTTLPRPKISAVRVQQVSGTAQSTLLVTWNTNTEVSSIVTYYPQDKVEDAHDEVNIALTKGEHRIILRSLLPDTDYILVVKGRDKIGNEAVSDSQRLTTATDTRPPQISDLLIQGSNIPSVGSTAQEQTAQLVISWNTDEPASGQVEYSEGAGTEYSQKTQEETNLTINHLVVISGLTPSKVYHLRAISHDNAGNQTESIDTVTITPKATENALNLVIGNLQVIFGFLKGLGQ